MYQEKPVIASEDENDHLAEEHGLIKTTAYIPDNTGKQRSNGAERAARHRKKKKESGLISVDIPSEFAGIIKAAGSFEAWFEQYKSYPPEKIKKILEAIEIAKKVNKLPKWKLWLCKL